MNLKKLRLHKLHPNFLIFINESKKIEIYLFNTIHNRL